jgi:signal transduction histidine kinase
VALTSTERLLRRTRRRLFAVTLCLLALLLVGVGAATVIVALGALDSDVDRALATAVDGQVAVVGNELPSGEDGHETGEQASGGADTVLLVLDPSGAVVRNRSGVSLPGLPNAAALDGALASGVDVRTVRSGNVNVRLRTVVMRSDGQVMGFVQGGFVLALHDQQSQSLVIAIVATGLAGLVAAAVITLLVTGRALVPIREGFEAQRRFVADASHELRTPAALIRANAEVLEREALTTGDGAALVGDIIAEADRLGGLVGDLLQLAAWDEAHLAITPGPIDAATLATDTVRGARALAAERGVFLAVETPASAPATGDRDRLVQLLLILVDNAIDHSPSGETVTVRVRREGDRVAFDVDDRGPGIPLAERERIFEPFTRLSGTTRHGSGGTGLGLAIARRIVEAHGGTIRADTPSGGGARFTVTLPGAGGQAPAESPG